MRINSYLIRSKSALVHRSCAGPSILRWSIDLALVHRFSCRAHDVRAARMTRAPRTARESWIMQNQRISQNSILYRYGTGTGTLENRCYDQNQCDSMYRLN